MTKKLSTIRKRRVNYFLNVFYFDHIQIQIESDKKCFVCTFFPILYLVLLSVGLYLQFYKGFTQNKFKALEIEF